MESQLSKVIGFHGTDRHQIDMKCDKSKFWLYKIYKKYIKVQTTRTFGEVAERLKALVLKTSNEATHSWVRIPPLPPLN